MADNNPKSGTSSSFLFILSFIIVVIATFTTIGVLQPFRDYVEHLIPFTARETIFHGRLFTKKELSQFTGADDGDVYLAILGDVFDVTKGRKHYGVGGGYGFFSGKDGSRAFVSGDFTEKGLVEDLARLSNSDILGLQEWNQLYKKDYKHIGHLIGHFYDKSGQSTENLKDFHKRLDEARNEKKSDEDDRQRFPPCNFAYTQGQGRRMWCSELSGGMKRTWKGVPRKYYQSGKTEPRCACVKDFGAPSGVKETVANNNRGDLDNKQFEPYENCDPSSFECYFPET